MPPKKKNKSVTPVNPPAMSAVEEIVKKAVDAADGDGFSKDDRAALIIANVIAQGLHRIETKLNSLEMTCRKISGQ